MTITTNNNSVLPIFRSIRSPRFQEADDLTERFQRIRRWRAITILFLFIVAVLSVNGETLTSRTIHSKKLLEEPNTFTPRIVMQAIEEVEASI